MKECPNDQTLDRVLALAKQAEESMKKLGDDVSDLEKRLREKATQAKTRNH